ncbi:MAG TPA: T9SS type A sorting domain-containing protein, partial [Cyclobacteriaceae bacterium]
SSSSPTGSNGSPIIGLYVNGSTTAQHSGGSYGTIGTKNDLQSNNNNFFTYIASISGSPLPISLSFFKVGEVNSEGVGLLWETKSELNFDYFNLQRSVNGKDFETIAEVQGHGTTKVSHEYSFTDKLALNGTSYYRLQSVDFDKYTETFNVVSVRYETGKNASVYPNPVTDSNLNFQLNFQPTTEILVTVTSMTGIERVREVIKANETSLNLGLSLEPGIYIVKMASMDFNKVSRIVVK